MSILYFKEGVVEIVNVQRAMGKAKPYQVKQVRELRCPHSLAAALAALP
jgi:hypothetical protein